ncbi:hypothetical protein FOH38_12420 [Lysinibacillus fusiformis]|nr:hypothetical protein FOH38_12420 [Lysinibacillus fusiformis]
MEQQTHLQKGLKKRHMTMSAIAGVIGAGLFMGSGSVIKLAGPSTIHMFGPDQARFFMKAKTISERWPDESQSRSLFQVIKIQQ